MTSTSQHVGKVPATIFALPSNCSPFQSRSVRNKLSTQTLLMMKPAPQARNSHWREAATAAYTIYVTTGRAVNGMLGQEEGGTKFSLVFSQTEIIRKVERWVSPAGSPPHASQMRSATDSPRGIDRVPSPNEGWSLYTGPARVSSPSCGPVEMVFGTVPFSLRITSNMLIIASLLCPPTSD